MLSHDLPLEPFLEMRTGSLQPGTAIDDIGRQVESVDLIADCKLQRRIDVALFLVAPHVDVRMIVRRWVSFVDERGISVEVEDDGLILREERVEVTTRDTVRMLHPFLVTAKVTFRQVTCNPLFPRR